MAVIYQKYRPSTFHDVTGQEHVITTIQNQFGSGSLAHAYLFTGPRGVGKTTTARLLAKIVNCTSAVENEPCNTCEACISIVSGQALDVYEIDAASHTDVENVRENIIKSVRFAPNILNKKVYIIDEVHMLSTSSFNALKNLRLMPCSSWLQQRFIKYLKQLFLDVSVLISSEFLMMQ